MDAGNIIYVLAVLAYFIYQATQGKKRKQEQEESRTGESGDEPVDAPVSFEELLKEIRSAQRPKPRNEPVPELKERPVYQEPVATVRPDVYRPQPVITRRSEAREEMDDEIQHYEGAFQHQTSELSKTSKGIPEIPSFAAMREDRKSAKSNRYARMLKNPETLRDSIVLSEILGKRKF